MRVNLQRKLLREISTVCQNKQVCISLITFKIVSSEELAELLRHKKLTKGTRERYSHKEDKSFVFVEFLCSSKSITFRNTQVCLLHTTIVCVVIHHICHICICTYKPNAYSNHTSNDKIEVKKQFQKNVRNKNTKLYFMRDILEYGKKFFELIYVEQA